MTTFSGIFNVFDSQFMNGLTEVAARADAIITTTEFTKNDAINYIGKQSKNVYKLPMICDLFPIDEDKIEEEQKYFIWTTNMAFHKNHDAAMEALNIYYEKYDGILNCYITGVNSRALNNSIKEMTFRKKIKAFGELSDLLYQKLLQNSAFLWHPTLLDNGTFSVVEAAALGVPSLSSDYPAMREIDRQASLNLTFFDSYDPWAMAKALAEFETGFRDKKLNLPTRKSLSNAVGVQANAAKYWGVVKQWL
ncbi:MAG: glycosyltransferase family 4 protein [Hyphomonadaceae bacterium]|nr:glycosyltransferase family 4 protein [Hyphomonadaceae bacterium]